MADNVAITPGLGATVAADDIGGVLFQRVKIAAGTDGAGVDVSTTNPMPVVQTGALPAGGNTIGTVNVTEPVTVDGTVGVSGTVTVGTHAISTVATITNPVTVTGTLTAVTAITNPVSISGTVPVSGTLTSVGTITNPVSISGTVPVSGTLTGITNPVSVTGTLTGITNTVNTAPQAGELHIGSVSGHSDFTQHNPTIAIATYATGQVLWDTFSLGSIARVNDGRALLQTLTILDEDDQGSAFDIIFFSALNTIGTVNTAVSLTDANSRDIIGCISVLSGDYIDTGAQKIATLRNVGLMLKPAASAKIFYCAAICRGAPTYTAVNAVKLRCGWFQD